MTDPRKNKPSASELYRVVGCQGYLQAKESMPVQNTQSEDAAIGSLIHDVLKDEGRGAERLPNDYYRWVATKSLELRDRFVADVFGESPIEVMREERFWLLSRDGDGIFSGQADFAAVDRQEGTVLVVDYKTMPGDVDDADENWQLLSLAACLSETLARSGCHVKQAFGAIIQPSVNQSPMLVQYNEQQITDLGALARRKLREAAMRGAPRTPGPWCKFCPVAGHCVEAQAMSVVLFKGGAIERVKSLTPEQITKLLPSFPVINKVMEAVRARAEELATAGELPGYEMKDGYVTTFVKDIPGFYDRLRSECTLTKEEFFANLKVSKEGIEELFRDRYSKQNGTTKKAATEKFKEIVSQFGEARPTKARLVQAKQQAQLT